MEVAETLTMVIQMNAQCQGFKWGLQGNSESRSKRPPGVVTPDAQNGGQGRGPISHGENRRKENSGGGIRTPDTRIMIPLL